MRVMTRRALPIIPYAKVKLPTGTNVYDVDTEFGMRQELTRGHFSRQPELLPSLKPPKVSP